MRILLVKLSSMGDVIHTLPAINDAANAIPGIKFTWLIEESFQEIAAWHYAVEKIIPIQLRKRNVKQSIKSIVQIRQEKYDLVIDAQGLIKSAILARVAKSRCIAGYDKFSCREWIASMFYQRKISVEKNIHAIERIRRLFAQSIGYTVKNTDISYGIVWDKIVQKEHNIEKYLVFLHGTTWPTKHWPEEYWQQLAILAATNNFAIYVTSANTEQYLRVQRLAKVEKNVKIFPNLSINQVASMLYHAAGVVSVDTGFAHLSVALEKPIVMLFGPSDPAKVGGLSIRTINLQGQLCCVPCYSRTCKNPAINTCSPPCFKDITPLLVWKKLQALLHHSVDE